MDTLNDELNSIISDSLAHTGPQNLWEELDAFAHAVYADAGKAWLLGVLALHVLLALLAVATRRVWQLQVAILSLCLAIVLGAETINTLAHTHWQAFASQDYFDPQGLFISIVLSAPLLVVSFFILLNGFCRASSMLVTVKRSELRRKQRQDAADVSSSAASSSTVRRRRKPRARKD